MGGAKKQSRRLGDNAAMRNASIGWMLMAAATAAAGDDLQPLRLVRAEISSVDGAPRPATSFRLDDHIYYFSEVTWEDTSRPAGTHKIFYKWYTGDAVAFSFGGSKTCDRTPFAWSAWISGRHLGVGHHRAELLVDDKVVASREFDVGP